MFRRVLRLSSGMSKQEHRQDSGSFFMFLKVIGAGHGF